MRIQARRTHQRDSKQDSAKGKNRAGPQFHACLQLQPDCVNRHALAQDVVPGSLVASHKARGSFKLLKYLRIDNSSEPIGSYLFGCSLLAGPTDYRTLFDTIGSM
jgi:hypothetical protein